jgi:hypothetical protein
MRRRADVVADRLAASKNGYPGGRPSSAEERLTVTRLAVVLAAVAVTSVLEDEPVAVDGGMTQRRATASRRPPRSGFRVASAAGHDIEFACQHTIQAACAPVAHGVSNER